MKITQTKPIAVKTFTNKEKALQEGNSATGSRNQGSGIQGLDWSGGFKARGWRTNKLQHEKNEMTRQNRTSKQNVSPVPDKSGGGFKCHTTRWKASSWEAPVFRHQSQYESLSASCTFKWFELGIRIHVLPEGITFTTKNQNEKTNEQINNVVVWKVSLFSVLHLSYN